MRPNSGRSTFTARRRNASAQIARKAVATGRPAARSAGISPPVILRFIFGVIFFCLQICDGFLYEAEHFYFLSSLRIGPHIVQHRVHFWLQGQRG